MSKLTPAMKQYMDIKNKHPDCILLFRMGDFYELFFEDARTASEVLDITLTKRGHLNETEIPLAGIPYHSLEPYLAKLIKAGYKVAICEQLEDPKQAKGVVKRGVTRIVTPGTVMEDRLLDGSCNNYLACLQSDGSNIGMAVVDITTGEFLAYDFGYERLFEELSRFSPAEIVLSSTAKGLFDDLSGHFFLTDHDERHFLYEKSKDTLKEHFWVENLAGFGIENNKLLIKCCGGLLSYIKKTQKTSLGFINKIKKFNFNDYMQLDLCTKRNLELLQNITDGGTNGSLLSVVDRTKTPMGKRLIRKWIIQPLLRPEEINYRLFGVEELKGNLLKREELKEVLRGVNDIERLISKISYGNSNGRDIVSLKNSLKAVPKIDNILDDFKSGIFFDIRGLENYEELVNFIENALVEEPPVSVRDGGFIKKGFNSELDELRDVSANSRKIIQQMEAKEKEKTGIKSLKIRYNKVFGYYIEITKTQLSSIPDSYIRKQTMVNAERFITEELKELETKIISAEERIKELEYELFEGIVEKIKKHTLNMQKTSSCIGTIDVLQSFADVSSAQGYTKPVVDNKYSFEVKGGRHPVIEKLTDDFITNDTYMNEERRTFIITGPNMSGKSTYMRQNAIIIIMAQMGCFVPADKAKLGSVDRVFTRVGASDDISSGQSTFMMEMTQTALILNNATERSFIILDEIGRGTSTFDGMALAWSVAEHITKKIRCKTLFATHYHTLNELANELKEVRNLHIAVVEEEDKVIFLHKIKEGGTDKSYGIHVAKIAGIPDEVIEKAKKVQLKLEEQNAKAKRQVVEKVGEKKDNEKIKSSYKILQQKTLGDLF
ncbi:MAG: DNA mismatch repair protein MutS [Candidatus Nanoarchaeia archaeon]